MSFSANIFGLKSSDGSAWTWGINTTGHLGDNTISNRSSPVSVVGGHSFTMITGFGTGTVLAIKANDGSAWMWGLGTSGQIGDNTIISRSSPVSVVGGHSFSSAAGSASGANISTTALKANDGSAWSWGGGGLGILGDNTATSKSSPVSVVGGHSFTQVAGSQNAAPTSNVYALKTNDGSVWSWGQATAGALGDNQTAAHRSSPVSVVGGHSFAQIAGAGSGSGAQGYGLKSNDGSVWSWGQAGAGALGDNQTAANRSSPVSVVGGHSFDEIVGGGASILARKANNGSVWAWGLGTSGQLGDLGEVSRSSPVSVVGGHSFTKIATQTLNGYGLKYDGTVWAWGVRSSGSIGDNKDQFSASPVAVIGSHVFGTLTSGGSEGVFAHAIKTTDGSLWAWGFNTSAQLGDNTLISKSSPVSVVGGHSFSKVGANTQVGFSAGGGFAIKANDGSAWAWGVGTSGQNGDNSATGRSSPVSVVGGHSFDIIFGGGAYNAAVKANDGSAWSWGLNTSGYLGDNSASNRSSPVSVVGGHSFDKIAAGGTNSLGLKANDGSAWMWGLGTTGQNGDNSVTSRSSPISVVGGHSFDKITVGRIHALALKANDGSAWGWGSPGSGQIGDNSITDRSSPVSVVGGHSFDKIVAGSSHSLAVKANDGSAWTWGGNSFYALGDNTSTNRSSPVSVVGGHSFIDILAKRLNSYGLKADGSVWSWGSRIQGSLGDNSTLFATSPIQVVNPALIKAVNGQLYGKYIFNDIGTGTISIPTIKKIDGVDKGSIKRIDGLDA